MESCHNKEGWKIVSRLRPFDLTPCFEEGFVLTSILLVFIVFGLASANRTWKTPKRERTRRSIWFSAIKLTFLVIAAALATANVVMIYIWQLGAVRQSYILELIALVVSLFISVSNDTRGRTGATSLLLFWPGYALAIIAWARTAMEYDQENFKPIIAVKTAIISAGLLSWCLELQGPTDLHPPEDESPLFTANVYSIWFFGWITPLLRKGASTYITADDLPLLVPSEQSSKLGEDLHQARKKYSSLWIALFAAYGRPYLAAAGLKVIQDCLAFSQPQLLRLLLAFISAYQAANFKDGSSDSPSPYEGYSIALLMFIASCVQTIVLQQYFQKCFETGMRVRAGLITQIYRKALVLSSDAGGKASGDIVNLMSVDATRLQDLCSYGLIAFSGPLQITLAFISLYNLLGWSAFVGVAIMVVSIPLNTVTARILKRMQEKQMKNRDKRTKLMSELLANVKSIKLYAWESAFIRKILFVRNDEELNMLKRIGIVTSLNAAMWTGIPLLVAFASFAVAVKASDKPLTSDVIFPAISLFMLLQFPLAMFAQITSSIIEASVSIKRLTEFFAADELHPDNRKSPGPNGLSKGDTVLSIVNADFTWTRGSLQPALEDINLKVVKGELICALGRVGCGKSSLLSAIAGDMIMLDGAITVTGTVSYAPQNPWILSATVRDNICFNHVYEAEFYETVINACALRQDLALLADGDMTEVGEKGITLSGGQRARISLARAIYARADLTMLDDVLAAVDSHVARHVFDHVIGPNGILAGKARILVSNSVTYAQQFDRLLYLRRGIILETETYESCMTKEDGELRKLIIEYGSNSGNGRGSGSSTPFHRSGIHTPTTEKEAPPISEPDSPVPEYSEKDTSKLYKSQSFRQATLASPPSTRNSVATGPSKETSEQGRVKGFVYAEYIKAASRGGFFLFLFTTIGSQVLSLAANYTLKLWGEANRESGSRNATFKYLLGYGLFSLLSIISVAVGAIVIWVFCAIRSARYLHDSMLSAVMRSPLSFFEQTPTGRIMNLFSKDTYVVDQVMARVIRSLIQCLAVCLTIFGVIGYNFPPFLLAIPPMTYVYLRIMKYYLATSRELKRIDAVSKSPIFAWFSESLAGTSTIRAFGQQEIFIATNERRIDLNQMAYMPSTVVNRWLATRLEFVGTLLVLAASVCAVTALITTGVDAGLVGLVLSYAMNTTSNLNWVVRMASEVEQNIVSVERILNYMKLTPEAPDEISERSPSKPWPSKGEVIFEQYSTRYREGLDLVLKEISMSIKPKEKIGIVGRTGAGKSSLLLALFRIIEPVSGIIKIDGIDISSIGLHDLRSGISIVPQSPDLFEGTMRENIDPMGKHSDADIWVALEQSRLKEYVESLPERLDAPVREGGSSLSAGQRQLLCFARALLKKSKLLVLDEATSAVDLETDKAIQEIIRGPVFADVTMLIIAHRLNTVIDSDRILVLSEGKIVEFDEPNALLANPNGIFTGMATEAGIQKGVIE